MNFIGDIAGIYDLIYVVVGFFIFPISKHSFFLSAMKKMFLVKTTDSHIFDLRKKQKIGSSSKMSFESDNSQGGKEPLKKGITKYLARQTVDYIEDFKLKSDVINYHRKISLTLFQSIKLFCMKFWTSLGFKPTHQHKLMILQKEGETRLLKCFDLVKICNDIKYLKLLTKYQLKPNIQTKFQIRHCKKSVIDLDDLVGT